MCHHLPAPPRRAVSVLSPAPSKIRSPSSSLSHAISRARSSKHASAAASSPHSQAHKGKKKMSQTLCIFLFRQQNRSQSVCVFVICSSRACLPCRQRLRAQVDPVSTMVGQEMRRDMCDSTAAQRTVSRGVRRERKHIGRVAQPDLDLPNNNNAKPLHTCLVAFRSYQGSASKLSIFFVFGFLSACFVFDRTRFRVQFCPKIIPRTIQTISKQTNIFFQIFFKLILLKDLFNFRRV